MVLLLNEWLFQATKPSFLTRISPLRKVVVALNAGLVLSLLVLGIFVFCWLAANLTKSRLIQKVFLAGPPAGLMAITFLLMVDNFTGTLFGYNMGAATGVWRFAYGLLFFASFIEGFKRINHHLLSLWSSRSKQLAYGVTGVLLVLCSILSFSAFHSGYNALAYVPTLPENANKPNILILSTDGLNASSMSVYGYPRATTPFLESLANETLRFNNHFANASHTTGSVVALLSGRHPTRTKVIYRPDLLTGKDAFLHFPGILRQLGYQNVDVSLEYYADPYDLNLRKSFHQANSRLEQYVQFGQILPISLQIKYDIEFYFLENLMRRIVQRLAHIFGLRDLGNPYFAVTHSGSDNHLDEDTIAKVRSLLHRTPQPFFFHVHLLGTHGPKFGPPIRVFSAGKDQNHEWMPDFYDDAVLAFDRQVEILLKDMRQRNTLNNTIVIITSDHGQKFSPYQPVPLIIRLPGGASAGVVTGPTQQIDIAPTLLNYLGIPAPPWMDGQSLLADDYRKTPIIGVYPTMLGEPKSGWREAEDYVAPYYSLGGLSVIAEGTWCGLSLRDNSLFCRPLESGFSRAQTRSWSVKTARKTILEHLKGGDYDVTSFTRDTEVKQYINP